MSDSVILTIAVHMFTARVKTFGRIGVVDRPIPGRPGAQLIAGIEKKNSTDTRVVKEALAILHRWSGKVPEPWALASPDGVTWWLQWEFIGLLAIMLGNIQKMYGDLTTRRDTVNVTYL